MILAAGLGTRLFPLTQKRPKPLFPIYNTPLLGIIINRLKKIGVTELAVNTHWLAPRITDYLEKGSFGGINITISHEPEILGTGGGIKKLEDFFGNEPFIVVNGDIFHNIDLSRAYHIHIKNKNLVTLILHNTSRFRRVEIDEENNIVGLRGKRLKETTSPVSLYAFTGIHIISFELIGMMPKGKGDIITFYQKLIQQGAPIRGELIQGHYWRDMGSFEEYHRLHRDLLQNRSIIDLEIFKDIPIPSLGLETSLGKNTRCQGYVSIGSHTKIGDQCVIKNSIIWDQVDVADHLRIENCIIGDGVRVRSSLRNQIVAGD